MKDTLTSRALAAVVLLAATTLTIAPATAAEEVSCTVDLPGVVVDPGLSTEPNSGVYFTDGETGTIDCGERKGTIGVVRGRYGVEDPDSCQEGGEFWGVFSYTFDGETTYDAFNGEFGPNTDAKHPGRLEGEHLSGPYTFTGTEGNCVTAPITVGKLNMVAKYRS